MSQPIRDQGGHPVFPIGPKNTNLVEDVEILLPVKFRWILFSGFREEVKHVSANQRPGPPSYFYDQPEKHKIGRGHWDLASRQVSLNSIQRFQRRSLKCLSQSEARAAILFLRSAQNTNLVEDIDIMLPVKFQRFQRRSRKCEKLTTEDRWTDDGQHVITIVHFSLRLRSTKKDLFTFTLLPGPSKPVPLCYMFQKVWKWMWAWWWWWADLV